MKEIMVKQLTANHAKLSTLLHFHQFEKILTLSQPYFEIHIFWSISYALNVSFFRQLYLFFVLFAEKY